MRLPSWIYFPFGYRIRVRLLTDTEMKILNDGDDAVDGLWIEEQRTIYVRKALSPKRRRYILAHELLHAAADYMHSDLVDLKSRPS